MMTRSPSFMPRLPTRVPPFMPCLPTRVPPRLSGLVPGDIGLARHTALLAATPERPSAA